MLVFQREAIKLRTTEQFILACGLALTACSVMDEASAWQWQAFQVLLWRLTTQTTIGDWVADAHRIV